MASPPSTRRPSTSGARPGSRSGARALSSSSPGSRSGRTSISPPPRPSSAGRALRSLGLTIELVTVAAAVLALALWTSIPDVRSLADENPTTTAFIDLRRSQAAADQRPFKLKWTWKPLAQISPHLRRAVVITEDWNFYSHGGVDWTAVEQAMERGLEQGHFSQGGSTITQQLAKNLYLSPSRSMVRKLRELLITFRLEDALEKPRILELYLNVAEWGDGIFGAEAAARRYYRRGAADLTAAQAARLAVSLPNPFERSPAQHARAMNQKAGRVLRVMRKTGAIGEAEMLKGLVELGLRVEDTELDGKPLADNEPEDPRPPRTAAPETAEVPGEPLYEPPPAAPERVPVAAPATTPDPAPETQPAPTPSAPEPGPATTP